MLFCSYKSVPRLTYGADYSYSFCRAMTASAATLAAPQVEVAAPNKVPGSSLPVTHTECSLMAGSYAFIRKLSPNFFVNSEAAPGAGIVLGLMASDGRPTSAEETILGQLVCDRFGPLMPTPSLHEHPINA